METRATGRSFILPAGIYAGLKSSTRSIRVNRQRLEDIPKIFRGLTASLLKQIPCVSPSLAERIKPVGKVKVPTELLSISLQQIRSDDPALLVNKNGYMGEIPSTFVELQKVMGKCISTSQNTTIKFSAGFITGEVDKKYVEKRGVFAWLDRFTDKPKNLGLYFMLNLFRYSPSDILEMALPLKGIEIVDDFRTKNGITLEDLTQDFTH